MSLTLECWKTCGRCWQARTISTMTAASQDGRWVRLQAFQELGVLKRKARGTAVAVAVARGPQQGQGQGHSHQLRPKDQHQHQQQALQSVAKHCIHSSQHSPLRVGAPLAPALKLGPPQPATLCLPPAVQLHRPPQQQQEHRPSPLHAWPRHECACSSTLSRSAVSQCSGTTRAACVQAAGHPSLSLSPLGSLPAWRAATPLLLLLPPLDPPLPT